MPQNANNEYYSLPVPLRGAQLGPLLVTADVQLPTEPFSFESAEDLFAELNTHEFIQTTLTGNNNDLAFMARDPGSTNYAIEYRDPSANNATLGISTHAFLTTALTGTNNDLTFTAVADGADGEDVSIELLDPAGNDQALAITVTLNKISASLATGVAGAITTTATQLKAALDASAPASALIRTALAADNNGSGVVTALAETNLGGRVVVASLATGAAGAITTTATQLKAAIEADADASAILVVSLKGADTGAGIVTALAHTVLGGPQGTNPTLDVTLKHGISTTVSRLATHSAFAQKTTATSEFKSFASVATYGLWDFNIGGTDTPIFAVSIVAVYRP